MEEIRFRNLGCCQRHSLSPPVAPLALQQLDEAEGQVRVGAVGWVLINSRERRKASGQSRACRRHLPASAGLGAGGPPRPQFDLKRRDPSQDARVKEPVLPRQSRIPPRSDGVPKDWPLGLPMVEGWRWGLQTSIVPFAAKSGLNSGLLAVDPKRVILD